MNTGLQNELSELWELVATLQGALAEVKTENQLPRQKLEFFIKRYFGGTKNESLNPRQLELLLAGLEALSTPAPAAEKPVVLVRASVTARPVRQALPTHLETERVVLEPDEVRQQPEGWRKLCEEVTEELDWKPAQFIKRLYIRPKYANAERIVIAPLPARLIDKGLPGAGLLTQVIVSKYEDHLPLYRQERIYRERHSVNLPRQTLCGRVEAAADWLGPIYREMKAGLVGRDYLQGRRNADPLSDPDVKGKSQSGWLWTYSAPAGDVVFEWQISRSRAGPREFLKNFRGKLQTDGYSVYESLSRERGEELILIGCWAHARRGFHEALGEGRAARGSSARSANSTPSKNTCARRTPALSCVPRCARGKAGPSSPACAGRWKSCVVACRPRACWDRPATTRWAAGKH
jgi:transposase